METLEIQVLKASVVCKDSMNEVQLGFTTIDVKFNDSLKSIKKMQKFALMYVFDSSGRIIDHVYGISIMEA